MAVQTMLSLLLSLFATTALIISVFHVRRSAALAGDANEISVVTGLQAEFRSPEFRSHLLVLENLPSGQPEMGFAGLGAASESGYAISYFVEYLGQLVVRRNISEDQVLKLMSTHLVTIWRILEPYIAGERQRRDQELPPGVPRRFLPHFEHLVTRALQGTRPDGSRAVREVELQRLAKPLAELFAAPARTAR